MRVQQGVLILGILSTLVPVAAVIIRGRSRQLSVATALTAAAIAAMLVAVLELVKLGPKPVPNFWVYGLMGAAVPVLLAGYLLAVGFGRENLEESVRGARRTFLILGFIGFVFLTLLHRRTFVSGYDWASGRGTIYLGALGKAYLTYLLVGIVVAGQAFERTYRASTGDLRPRLRLPMFGFSGFLVFAIFILTTGLLYSSIGLGKLVALAIPVGFASIMIGYGYVRGSIMDVATPVSRDVVYSSFTAFAAALFVVSVGVAAQIASVTRSSPDEILVLALGFLTALVAILMLVSNRFQRLVRRFIDRNFYVNRYDYRSQWSKVTEALVDAKSRDEVLNLADRVLKEAFLADRVTISLEDPATGETRPVLGPGTNDETAVLGRDCPLCVELLRGRKSLLLDRKTDDFTYIPIYAENRDWLDKTASQIVAPLLSGDELLGIVGLERDHSDDRFTFEDVALLDRFVAQIASTLRATQLAAALAETAQSEALSEMSRRIVHDVKNYIQPLRLVAKNLIEHQDRPDIAPRCAKDLTSVADRLDHLVQTLRVFRDGPGLELTSLDPNELVRVVLSDLQGNGRHNIVVETRLRATLRIRGDADGLRRVVENLVTNAFEAMGSEGYLIIETNDGDFCHGPSVCIEVTDDGPGIPEEFLRTRLFKAFATTKKKGLGLGLYQCRSIIQAHGGELTVRSRADEGTVFRIALAAEEPTLRSAEKKEDPIHADGTVRA
jgi:putative PEP-CTERM system histidine kinase